MSKSIYDEVLEIIDKNIFELPDGFAVLYEIRKKIKQALEQAQKQQKLLKLYRELSKYVDENTYAHELPEITRLKILIKELENE